MKLREHIRKLQVLENGAAEKAGMRFLLLDERKLMGRNGKSYVKKYIKLLELDIFPEMIEAAKMGKELNEEVTKK